MNADELKRIHLRDQLDVMVWRARRRFSAGVTGGKPMAAAPDLPGLSYDVAKARSIADGCTAVLRQAIAFGGTTNDQLAALAILAARVLKGSPLGRNAGVGAAAVSAMTLELVHDPEFSDLLG